MHENVNEEIVFMWKGNARFFVLLEVKIHNNLRGENGLHHFLGIHCQINNEAGLLCHYVVFQIDIL